ncbi:MAG: histidinol dehydrogenase [bacterium]
MKHRIIRNKEELKELLISRKNSIEVSVEVERIISYVRERGDRALIELSNQFDGTNFSSPDEFRVKGKELEDSLRKVGRDFLEAITKAIENVREFYNKMPRNQSWFYLENNRLLGQIIVPLESVGIYVPGGRAPYPSTVVMAAVPAYVAGVKRVVVTTPKSTPEVLATCRILGIEEVYRLGGAHSIAALAYGTDTISRVEKIVGPGNKYVQAAKKYVFGDVGIDTIAGPSEIAILADRESNPKLIAIDLLSQAEHDPFSMALLITNSGEMIEMVKEKLDTFIEELSTKEVAKASWESWGGMVLVDSIEEGIEVINLIAPEHLELNLKEPMKYLNLVKNAGTIFIGELTPEAIGDYIAGPSHILPTGGSARFSSGLSISDFVKSINISQYYRITEDARLGAIIAEREGFSAHRFSLEWRMDN